jgi:hypothetical protein
MAHHDDRTTSSLTCRQHIILPTEQSTNSVGPVKRDESFSTENWSGVVRP